MVELASKIKGKSLNKDNTNINLSICIEEIDHDSSYPMLDMIVSRSIYVFEMDDALIHMLGA